MTGRTLPQTASLALAATLAGGLTFGLSPQPAVAKPASPAAPTPAPTPAAPAAPAAPAKPAAPSKFADRAALKPAGPAKSPIVTEATLQDALNTANGSRKVLIVTLAMGPRQKEAADKLWTNTPLAQWAYKHALVFGVTRQEDLDVLQSIDAVPTGATNDPICFLDSKQLRIFGSAIPQKGSRIANPKADPAIGSLLKLHWTLSRKCETDEGLAAVHMRPDPAEEGKIRSEMARRMFACTEPGEREVTPVPLPSQWLEQLLAARTRLALLRDKPEAERSAADMIKAEQEMLRLYVWSLWHDDLIGARHGVLARELADLARTSELTRLTLTRMRDSALATHWHREAGLITEVIMLGRMIGDGEELMRFLDDSLNDADVVTTMPASDRMKYELILRQANWSVGGDPAKLVDSIIKSASDSAPKNMNPQAWFEVRVTRTALQRLQLGRSVILSREGKFPIDSLRSAAAQLAGTEQRHLLLPAAMTALAAGEGELAVIFLDQAAKSGTEPGIIDPLKALAAKLK
jgi:hypothetical protein